MVTIHYCAHQNFLDLCHKFKQYNDFFSEEIQVVVQKSLWVGHSFFNYAVSAPWLFIFLTLRGFSLTIMFQSRIVHLLGGSDQEHQEVLTQHSLFPS